MDLSPILVGGVSLRSRGRSIHRPAARDLRQQASERGQRTDADLRPGREAQRNADLRLEHPGRHLEATASIPTEAAPQRGAAPSPGHLVDVDRETTPGVPRIQQPPFRGPVGVQASSCTTSGAPTTAGGATERRPCGPSLTPSHSPGRRLCATDHSRRAHRPTQPTPSVRSSIGYYTAAKLRKPRAHLMARSSASTSSKSGSLFR
jgi:hypothetical protein